MSSVVLGTLVMVGLPALIGFAVPGPVRKLGGLAAAIFAIVIWVDGINMHSSSVVAFTASLGFMFGALLRESFSLLRGFRPALTARSRDNG